MMNEQQTITNYSLNSGSLVYYRLIALWVLSEAMLGGIIHGLKLPVSGLVVGGCAVICISLIAWYIPTKGSIIKATIIVAIFKMMLSPQAPLFAYFAVFFQGLLGELLFWNRRYFKTACMTLALLALIESGFQRIVELTVIYGNTFWKAINDFINGLTGQTSTTNYSLLIGGLYLLVHLAAGILIGRWAAILPGRISIWSRNPQYSRWLEGWEREDGNVDEVTTPVVIKKKKYVEKGMFVVWIILIALLLQSWLKIGEPLMPSSVALRILIRSFIVVLTWHFLVSPLLKKLLHYWLQKKESKQRQDVRMVMELLPATKELASQSWRASAGRKGWNRVVVAGRIILVNALQPANQQQFFILTGAVQTGKTTSLAKWSDNRNDVFGILTPVISGKRVFMDAQTREQFPMEAVDGEKEMLMVGRFIFSKAGFDKAIGILRQNIDAKGWLVIDEIGPLELKGEGFSDVLKEVIGRRKEKTLLIVRDGLDKKITDTFRMDNNIIITSLDQIGIE